MLSRLLLSPALLAAAVSFPTDGEWLLLVLASFVPLHVVGCAGVVGWSMARLVDVGGTAAACGGDRM
jgi:hypothetical protein